jgi:hypothetical protein
MIIAVAAPRSTPAHQVEELFFADLATEASCSICTSSSFTSMLRVGVGTGGRVQQQRIALHFGLCFYSALATLTSPRKPERPLLC